MSNVAFTDKKWLEAARWECLLALQTDYSSSDLLLKVIAIDLTIGSPALQQEANTLFELFKRLDPKSPLIEQMQRNSR